MRPLQTTSPRQAARTRLRPAPAPLSSQKASRAAVSACLLTLLALILGRALCVRLQMCISAVHILQLSPSLTAEESAPQPSGQQQEASGDQSWHDRVGPAAHKWLRESGLSLDSITPTGPRGIVTKGDVLAAMGGGQKPQPHKVLAVCAHCLMSRCSQLSWACCALSTYGLMPEAELQQPARVLAACAHGTALLSCCRQLC